MSYYLLQKTRTGILSPVISQRPMRNMTSTSVFLMCKDIQRELVNMCIYDGAVSYSDIIQFVNPYEYIFSPCPQTNKSVCTLQTATSLYCELTEVFDLVDVNITNPSCLIISESRDDIMKCIKNKYPLMITSRDIKLQYGFVFHEVKHNTSLDNYLTDMVKALMILLNSQSDNGTAIIKAHYLFHRPVLDIIYTLSSMYEKVYIVKPNTSNAMSHDKYIVCINKIPNKELYATNYDILLSKSSCRLFSLLDHKLPLTFINKINDINVILGQRQLEYLDQALTIMSSVNKYEVINSIVSKNVQKSAVMCEKLGLPYVKTNMFLEKRSC
jgi:hypothetical protein